ncbi:MAG: pantoate--beta-alanine ligase [Lysobacteraceae bacterium]
MILCQQPNEIFGQVRAWQRDGLRVAFVPTMGNLHAGHFSLVALARRHADRVVASVFVNPTQFGPNEDFTRYPRTLGPDEEGLRAAGCDAMFVPDVQALYPLGAACATRVEVPQLDQILCGAHRPGHFAGVGTVVLRLLHCVPADCAVFGSKDYQQLQIVRHMVRDLLLPIEVIAGPTCREPDGLAMSSRNQYLSPPQRALAPKLFAALRTAASAIQMGQALDAVVSSACLGLAQAGFEVDYFEFREAETLAEWRSDVMHGVVLVAARLGSTRLIDNVEFVLAED